MVQGPTGMPMNNINKPSAYESILPHLSQGSMQKPGLGESGSHYPDGFCELLAFASNHVLPDPSIVLPVPWLLPKKVIPSKR